MKIRVLQVFGRVLPCNISPSSKNTLYVLHNTSHVINKVKQVMLVLQEPYAPGLALLKVKLLKSCGLWTFNLLLLDLLLLQNNSSDGGSYMQ
jgi:hypothetical protein